MKLFIALSLLFAIASSSALARDVPTPKLGIHCDGIAADSAASVFSNVETKKGKKDEKVAI